MYYQYFLLFFFLKPGGRGEISLVIVSPLKLRTFLMIFPWRRNDDVGGAGGSSENRGTELKEVNPRDLSVNLGKKTQSCIHFMNQC